MTIPTSGSFTSETVRAEWGGSYPLTSETVRAWAGLGYPFTSDQLRGKSAFGLSINVGAQTTQTIGSSVKRIVHRRNLTANITGLVEPVSYSWSISTAYHATLLSGAATATAQVSLSYDAFEPDGEQTFDSGTVYLTITNGDGKTASASASFSLG